MANETEDLWPIEKRVAELEAARKSVNAGIDEALVVLRGSREFSDAVERLLVGTPYEKPKGGWSTDFKGLYGRLRDALQAAQNGETTK